MNYSKNCQNEIQPLKCSTPKPADNSLTVGTCGPVLLQDTILHETLETFVHEKIIERSVHTKGYGAFGYFTAYQSMKEYTKAVVIMIFFATTFRYSL